jgi:plasmid maintenance system killer protein
VYVFDDQRLGIPESAISLIACIPGLIETDSFCRRFERLERSLQSRWQKLKHQLPDGIPRSARFEKLKGFEGNIFSMRLNDNFRVHLRQMNGAWEAFAVGSHKEMGHG